MNNQDSFSNFETPYQSLLDHCEAAGLKFRSDHDNKSLSFSISGKVATYDVTLVITEEDTLLQIYVCIPVVAAEENLRPLITEFVARANHRLAIGHFNLNVDEGRLLYYVNHVVAGKPIADDIIHVLLGTALGTADRYFPALARVVFGGMTPADAVYLSELDYHITTEEQEADASAPATPKKPVAAPKKKRSRKEPRSESPKPLPGLFDTPLENDDKAGEAPPSS